MRTFRKALCLVLAMLFVLGLCTIGAGAAYSDADKINYKDAVTVMTGLGIIQGYPDGSFEPTKNVTRAEAAKMISYMMVGTDEVEKWPEKQVFDDVPADHWASKYITFCEYNNVINGDGNGKFRPNDPVKKSELAKMLLAACGYGQLDEFIGEGWDQNVATRAFECKVLKDIKGTADWNSPASREETALMVYNTMMRTYRVVLSDDTTSYEPAWINGRFDVTFAQSPWGLQNATGIVYRNKANTKGAQGTYLSKTGSLYYETSSDEDASVLGHKVNIMYRVEGVAPYQKNVAYFVEDLCRDVSGVEANYKELVTVDGGYVAVVQGDVTVGTPFKATADKYTRHLDGQWLYILDENNAVIGCKSQDTFVIVPISVNPYNFVATVRPVDADGKMYDSQEVVLPEGVKHGDLVCLYQCGDVYTVKPTSKKENVDIYHKEMNVGAVQYWTYNDYTIVPTRAANVTRINLASLTCVNPRELTVLASDTVDGTIKRYEPVLNVLYTYTLYYDCEGGVFAYGDERPTNEVTPSYAMFVAAGVDHDHSWGRYDAGHDERHYVQLLWLDGTIEKVYVAKRADADFEKGDIVTVKSYGLYNNVVTKVEENVIIRDTIPPMVNNPEYEYDNATFCYHNNGEFGTLLYLGDKARPAKDAQVSMVYKVVKIGTVYVRQVIGVWFYQADYTYVDPYVPDSYIYVTRDDIQQERIVNGKGRNFYFGLKDGVPMQDLRIVDDLPYDCHDQQCIDNIAQYIGFNRYFIDANGDYHLLNIEKSETPPMVQNVYLVDADSAPKDIPSNAYCFIKYNKLWLYNEATGYHDIGFDLSEVNFVRVVGYTEFDEMAGFVPVDTIPLDSVAAVQQLLLTQLKDETTKTVYTVKLNISFVDQILVPGVHSIGGKTIYITDILAATETNDAPEA